MWWRFWKKIASLSVLMCAILTVAYDGDSTLENDPKVGSKDPPTRLM